MGRIKRHVVGLADCADEEWLDCHLNSRIYNEYKQK
jgi:hypothetical protein